MRYYLVVLVLFGALVCAYRPASSEETSLPGQLWRWSRQTTSCDKVIIFVHGRRLDIPTTGPSQELLESIFSFKLVNFESVGRDYFGKPTSALAEYWFYGYYPQQSPEAIAADLAQQIQTNPNLRDKQIAVVGYSEGGLVCWLLDQRYSLIEGGVLLGAPILGSPLADKSVRDVAVIKILSATTLARKLSNFLDRFAEGSVGLEKSYPESGQTKSQLMLYAGRVQPCSPGILTRSFLDEIGNWVTTGPDWQTSNKRFAEAMALVIANSVWRDNSSADKQSDGVVPVSSATCGGISNSRIWEEYDHYELSTGAGLELALDREILGWLDQVLQLKPKFAAGGGVPSLPGGNSPIPFGIEIPALPEINLNQTDLLSYRFAYIHDGKLAFTNRDWSNQVEFATGGECSYPRFAPDGKTLVFTNEIDGNKSIYRLTGQPHPERVVDGRWADFSPNGQWLAYEGRTGLSTYRFSKAHEYCVVKNVQLVCPPLWVTKGWLGRIYFVARASDGSTNLYVVSPRARNKELKDVDKVLPNCQGLFLTRGLISGVVAISQQDESYQLSIVSNWLQSAISFEISPAQNNMDLFESDWGRWQFDWSTGLCSGLQSALLDSKDQYALYLEMTDQTTNVPGIYLFSFKRELNGFSFEDSYDVNEIVTSAYHLDLNPAASN